MLDPGVLLGAVLTGLPLLFALLQVQSRLISPLRFLYGAALMIAALVFGLSHPFEQGFTGGVRLGVLVALYWVGLWSIRSLRDA